MLHTVGVNGYGVTMVITSAHVPLEIWSIHTQPLVHVDMQWFIPVQEGLFFHLLQPKT